MYVNVDKNVIKCLVYGKPFVTIVNHRLNVSNLQ